jgi:flagellum-specific ATP synthase
VADTAHLDAARRLRQMLARHVGAELDTAVQTFSAIRELLQQNMRECAPLADSVRQMKACIAPR